MNKVSISPKILAILNSLRSEDAEHVDFISEFLLPYVLEKGSYYRAKDEILLKMKEVFGEEMIDED